MHLRNSEKGTKVYMIEGKLQAYTAFFKYTTAGFIEIDKIFEKFSTNTETLIQIYGGLDEDDNASEFENAQLSQLRILHRDFLDYMKSYAAKIGILRDELTNKIEFAQTMLEGMEAQE